MPTLNWTTDSVRVLSASGPRLTELSLELGEASLAALVSALEDVYQGSGGELRHRLPEGWTLFWKKKEDCSRALLAHPQTDEWVGTLALTSTHGWAWVQSLRSLSSGQSSSVHDLGALDPFSNLHVVIRVV